VAKGKGNASVAAALNGETAATAEESQKVKEVSAEEKERAAQEEILATDKSAEMGEELPTHDLANLFPAMSEEEYRNLKLDIARNGQLVDIYTYGGAIIDGRHRYRAARELGITPRVVEYEGEGSPTQFVVAMNLNRRHLTTSQRTAIALELLPLFQAEAAERMQAGTKQDGAEENRDARTATAQAGMVMNVSGKQVANAKRVQEIAPDLLPKIASGEMTVNKALAEANARPTMPDGTPRTPVVAKARNSANPPDEEMQEGALFELRDMLTLWLESYERISALKPVSAEVRVLLTKVQEAEAQNLDAGVDINNPEASYDIDDEDAEPSDAELAAIESD
jgi:ParB-like chromosome segregation protein Spo0J